jgi:DNA polymerase V
MAYAVFSPQKRTKRSLPFYLSSIKAGFPSPADDYIERSLDLNEHLIKHPSSTFFVKVKGDSMVNAGIFSGDILIVDRSVQSYHNKIIVAIFNGEFTVKRFRKAGGKIFLIAENPDYPGIAVTEEMDFEIWGVVTNVIHQV